MGIAGKNAKEKGSISTRKIPPAAAMGFSLFETPASCGQFFSLCKVTSKYLSNFHVGLYIQTRRYRYEYVYIAN
jgi:hypothetical protein